MVIVRPVPLPVRCLNCGSGDTLASWSLIVAILALVVAGIALYITLREHREFMKQLGARARFELAVHLEHGPEGEVKLDPRHPEITFRVSLRNVGDKAAGETVLNVSVPASVGPRWSSASGVPLSSPHDAATTLETLTLPDGAGDVEAHMIAKTIPRVARRAGQMTWFTVVVRQPTDLPVRVVAQCDDLPDDQEDVRCERLLRVR